MTKLPTLALFALTLACTSLATATPWIEVGEAGDLPATAQITMGVGSLTSISGFIGERGSFIHGDMFRIHIPMPSLLVETA